MEVMIFKGTPVISGGTCGSAIVSQQPISFWGGVNPRTGEIIDRRHDCSGLNIAGKVFVFPQGKGSSTGSAVLLECIRAGVAPAGIVNLKLEPILALGAILAQELYQKTLPIVILDEEAFNQINDGDEVAIEPDGKVSVTHQSLLRAR
jgi:predicted aconitase with swiveling domain